jgi:hypothetical protein
MATRQPLHAGRNCTVCATESNQMEVIGHDAIGVDPNAGVLTGLGEQFEKSLVVAVLEEDLPLVGRTIHDV